MKRIGVASVSALALGALAVGPASPVDAALTPAPQHGPNQNGCTLSPDSGVVSGVYYNFHSACDWHDLCYYHHSQSRAGCDSGFRSLMRGWCANAYGSWYEAYHKGVCYGVAEVYYQAVRAFGGPFY